MLEKEQCLNYPWSHNSVHDEASAHPVIPT